MKNEMVNGYVVKFAIWFNPKVGAQVGMVLVEEKDETGKPSGMERGFIGNAMRLDEEENKRYVVENGDFLPPEAIYAAQGTEIPLKKRRALVFAPVTKSDAGSGGFRDRFMEEE